MFVALPEQKSIACYEVGSIVKLVKIRGSERRLAYWRLVVGGYSRGAKHNSDTKIDGKTVQCDFTCNFMRLCTNIIADEETTP